MRLPTRADRQFDYETELVIVFGRACRDVPEAEALDAASEPHLAVHGGQDLGLSHAHYDHVGNCGLFHRARWIAQKGEHDAMFGDDPGSFGFRSELYASLRENPVTVVEGDHDIFGDGAVRLVSTPGHTPGHSSLLMRLPDSGPVLPSGDIAHNRTNYRCCCVPSFNADKLATVASIEKVDALLREERATLWINHDIEENAALPHAPAWIT